MNKKHIYLVIQDCVLSMNLNFQNVHLLESYTQSIAQTSELWPQKRSVERDKLELTFPLFFSSPWHIPFCRSEHVMILRQGPLRHLGYASVSSICTVKLFSDSDEEETISVIILTPLS